MNTSPVDQGETQKKLKPETVSSRDPLRKTWIAYTGFVTLEGFLIVFGFSGIVIAINGFLIYKGGPGLGYFIFAFGLLIAYFAVKGIMRPLSLWRRSGRVPRARDLPSTLQIVIPVLKKKQYSPDEMRKILETNSPFHFFDKNRFWRNLTIFVVGMAGTLSLYFL